jgi:hypothetical protein
MPEAHANLGLALARLHRLDGAEWHCRESLRLRPRASAYVNLAGILMQTGRFAESEACLEQALAISPRHLRIPGCYGDVRAAQLDFAGALEWYEKALELAPEAGLTRPARAMVWLAMGDFDRGWDEYELRWKLGDCQPVEFREPQWNGERFEGKTALLHTEQGLGDTLQFVRFAPLVKAFGGEVILASQPSLISLLSRVPGIDRIIPNVGELPEFDCHLPLLSVPRVLRTREDTIPREVPYLTIPPEAVAGAESRLERGCGPRDGRLRVGIAWAGSSRNPDDANRSMRLEQLDRLLQVAGVQFVSLQRGVVLPADCPIVTVEEETDNLVATAALVQQLDLVISVDTMVAHLAGALGRPVWTLLKFAPDWRWMTGRPDSPWYPSMRLFRQPRFGDWGSVIDQVVAALAEMVDGTLVLRQDFVQPSAT